MSRPIWMQPVIYNEDRFTDPTVSQPQPTPPPPVLDEADEAFGVDDEDAFESLDTEPMDYTRGPHSREFGVNETSFDSTDTEPVDYSRGPHEDEFGVEDEDEDEAAGEDV